VDTASIINRLSGPKEAAQLPCGSIVGDRHGGLSFSDDVAAVLEARSTTGWKEIQTTFREVWTLIVLDIC
jgi:hypothetical protein